MSKKKKKKDSRTDHGAVQKETEGDGGSEGKDELKKRRGYWGRNSWGMNQNIDVWSLRTKE